MLVLKIQPAETVILDLGDGRRIALGLANHSKKIGFVAPRSVTIERIKGSIAEYKDRPQTKPKATP